MRLHPVPLIPVRVDFGDLPHCPGCGKCPSTHVVFWSWDHHPESCHYREWGAAAKCNGQIYFYHLSSLSQALIEPYLKRLDGPVITPLSVEHYPSAYNRSALIMVRGVPVRVFLP